MLNKIIKFGQKAILHEFSLQKRPLVNRTVEKALEANIPKEIWTVFLSEKILLEWSSKVAKLLLHCLKSVGLGVGGYELNQGSMEKSKVAIVLL